jgi:hypothetical protein
MLKNNIYDEHLSMTIDGIESQGADPPPLPLQIATAGKKII